MNNKYLWIIGAIIGMSIGDALWRNSKMYKRHQEEMQKSEERTNEIINRMVKDAFPTKDFEDKLSEQIATESAKLDEEITRRKQELEEAKANDKFKAELESLIKRANRAVDIY